MLRNYSNIITTLEEVSKGNDEYAVKGSGLLMQMESFDIFFGLKLAHLLFAAAEQLSTNLQAKDITMQEATCGAQLLTTHYKSLRNEAKFNIFYDDVLAKLSGLTDEPTLHRRRPRRLDEGDQPHRYQEPKERYRHIYFEALEVVYGEVERRFDQSDFQVIQGLESLLLDAANGKNSQPDKFVLEYLENDIDQDRFIAQLPMVADMMKIAFQDSPIKAVTNVRTIAEGMNKSSIYKRMMGEIDKVLKIYFTVPVTTATAERSFSSLRRLKTFLRNSMTQKRLNNLLMLYVHTQRTDELDLTYIAKEFISVNKRRLNYFGKL